MFGAMMARKRGGASRVISPTAPFTSTLATTAQSRNSNAPSTSITATRNAQLRSTWRRMMLAIAPLRLVVGKKDVLELRLGKGDLLHRRRGERAQQRIHVAADPERHLPAPPLGARDAGDFAQPRRRIAGKTDAGLAQHLLAQTRDRLQRDHLALPEDRHASTHRLDLRKHMRGEKDRAPARREAGHDGAERLLYERIEAVRRLIEEQERRIVLHRDDEPQLLARAVGEELDAPDERCRGHVELVEH